MIMMVFDNGNGGMMLLDGNGIVFNLCGLCSMCVGRIESALPFYVSR